VIEAWQFGFTEMMNNAIDHSGGIVAVVRVRRTAGSTEMLLGDNGVGIFKKIQAALHLEDQRHAVLELAKGKFTTDPQRHSGEGIFFTSRIFDSFSIHSGGVFFFHRFGTPEDWVLEGSDISGTTVRMSLSNHTTRQVSDVFGQFHTADDFGFTKTVVPVRLAQYGDDKLVSRSQAKRVLARIQLFKSVIFDFEGVDSIGQAFADEIFRVFAKLHPAIDISAVNASPRVNQMIQHARAANVLPPESKSILAAN
jgi:anti-sigma regulatory factor (Ser/Thr protein kinase)